MKKYLFFIMTLAAAFAVGVISFNLMNPTVSANSPPTVKKDVKQSPDCFAVKPANITPWESDNLPITASATAETRHARKIVLPNQFKGQPIVVKRE